MLIFSFVLVVVVLCWVLEWIFLYAIRWQTEERSKESRYTKEKKKALQHITQKEKSKHCQVLLALEITLVYASLQHCLKLQCCVSLLFILPTQAVRNQVFSSPLTRCLVPCVVCVPRRERPGPTITPTWSLVFVASAIGVRLSWRGLVTAGMSLYLLTKVSVPCLIFLIDIKKSSLEV